jgi:hypothetical protein
VSLNHERVSLCLCAAKSKSWKRRWFVLKDTTLYCFNEDRRPVPPSAALGGTIPPAPLKSLDLKQFCVVHYVGVRARGAGSAGGVAFEICSTRATLILCARDEADYNGTAALFMYLSLHLSLTVLFFCVW